MNPSDPKKQSRKLRQFKPTRRRAGVFGLSVVFADASLLVLAFFLANSPFVLQPGVNITLPASPFIGGAPFGSMVLTVTRGDWFFFNDERIDYLQLTEELNIAATRDPDAPLIIEADERASHGAVIAAWNAALNAGIKEVSIASDIAVRRREEP